MFGLTKRIYDLFTITFAFANGCMFYDYAAARVPCGPVAHDLTNIRNQFWAEIFFIRRTKVLFNVVQWNFPSSPPSLSLSLIHSIVSSIMLSSHFMDIYWNRHVYHLPVSVDILYTIESTVGRSVGRLVGDLIAVFFVITTFTFDDRIWFRRRTNTHVICILYYNIYKISPIFFPFLQNHYSS